MGSRIDLHNVLVAVLGSGNVYYQPPSTVTMNYPAIVYSRDAIDSKYANNNVYGTTIKYGVIVIDKNPDSLIPGKVALMPTAKHNSNYISNNLNHDAFTIQF